MKYLATLLVSLLLLSGSCRKPQDSPSPGKVVAGKNWKLIFYSFNGTDITNKFSNCTISFALDGTLKVSNGGQNFKGTWEEVSEPLKLKMDVLSSNQYVQLLNKEWVGKLLNPTKVELVDDKVAPQETMKLTQVP